MAGAAAAPRLDWPDAVLLSAVPPDVLLFALAFDAPALPPSEAAASCSSKRKKERYKSHMMRKPTVIHHACVSNRVLPLFGTLLSWKPSGVKM